jgi:hypothetical protein
MGSDGQPALESLQIEKLLCIFPRRSNRKHGTFLALVIVAS